MVVLLLLYDLRVNLIRHVIALLYRYGVSNSCDCNVMVEATMRHAGGMMEIMPCVLDGDQDARKGLYHIT
jgi:hypothetical protein